MRLLAEIALVVIAGVGVSVCWARLPRSASIRWRRARTADPSRPGQLVALERLVSGAASSALQVHAYLRPVLVEITSRRLAAHGQALARMPDVRGRQLLGDDLWDIVRPARPFPEDRHGPGVSPERLGAMLEVLERL